MTFSFKNALQLSPQWMVNLTGILAILTPILPGIVNTMPAGMPDVIKEWLIWIMSTATAVSGAITMFSKSKKVPADLTQSGSKES